MCRPSIALIFMIVSLTTSTGTAAEFFRFQLQSQRPVAPDSKQFSTVIREEQWKPAETAFIVCDVWDLHHSRNAVLRLEEFLPRLNSVISEARRRGATIIHSPSDCMAAYASDPARLRAAQTVPAAFSPHGVASWCSAIPAEERAVYPIDQSDGGDDDDPHVHQQWADHLASLGRNPNLPWQRQNDQIHIDQAVDYITDRGDEVWNILQAKGIQNVVLTGVHTNMCVLGRPFGLRQLARNGLHVTLMRDMTDTMYNPARWPYVSHFEGTRRIISHIERYVCPTVSSEQLLGGEAFRFKGDTGATEPAARQISHQAAANHWTLINLPREDSTVGSAAPTWYRCVAYIPRDWINRQLSLEWTAADAQVWCNGTQLIRTDGAYAIPATAVAGDDYNLIVLKTTGTKVDAPTLASDTRRLELVGRWQTTQGENIALANMPLPAKFGGSADIVFTPPDPLWTARPLTQRGEFTPGIEGPACDRWGNIFAVNYGEQGTIGRVLPTGEGEIFVRLPAGSIGNGIRFASDGSFFVADYTKHNILKVEPSTKAIRVFAHDDRMNQPNDLAIAPDGTLYASDPNWAASTGQLWRIDLDGQVTRLAAEMGTTNGIEVSPDGKTLYVNESVQRNVWAFDLTADRQLQNKRLVRKFDDFGFDGMRCDVDGNLYITRHGKGTVIKMNPEGKILQEIPVLGTKPSNLCFGGADGCTVYVTEVDGTRLVQFRVDRPGRSWQSPL